MTASHNYPTAPDAAPLVFRCAAGHTIEAEDVSRYCDPADIVDELPAEYCYACRGLATLDAPVIDDTAKHHAYAEIVAALENDPNIERDALYIVLAGYGIVRPVDEDAGRGDALADVAAAMVDAACKEAVATLHRKPDEDDVIPWNDDDDEPEPVPFEQLYPQLVEPVLTDEQREAQRADRERADAEREANDIARDELELWAIGKAARLRAEYGDHKRALVLHMRTALRKRAGARDTLGDGLDSFAAEIIDDALVFKSDVLTAKDGTSRAHWQLITVVRAMLRAIASSPVLNTPVAMVLDEASRHVLTVLLLHANGSTRECHPGMLRLSAETGLSAPTIRKRLVLLCDAGIIEIASEGGEGYATVYRFADIPTLRAIRQREAAFRDLPDDDSLTRNGKAPGRAIRQRESASRIGNPTRKDAHPTRKRR